MRPLILLALLAGCDGVGFDEGTYAPSQPPPVPVAAGTLVEQTWQFRNDCPRQRYIALWREYAPTGWLGGATTSPGETFYAPVRCFAGESICYGEPSKENTQDNAAGCAPCSPGVLPLLGVRCQ